MRRASKISSVTNASLDYARRHWRGELSLTKSLLLNGVVGYVLILLLGGPMVLIGGNSAAVTLSYMVIFLIWSIWAGVGISRCALLELTSKGHSWLSRTWAALALCTVAYFCAYAAYDVWKLFIEPFAPWL